MFLMRGRQAFTLIWCLALAALFACPAWAGDPKTLELGRALEGGNAIYRIFIEESNGTGRLGTFTVGTGPSHTNPDQNILYGAFDPISPPGPGSSYLTIRSYTTQSDYVSSKDIPDSIFIVYNLNSFGTVQTLPNGFRTEWVLPGPPTTPDALTITQEVLAMGSTQQDSRVQVTTRVLNQGASPVFLGIRYLWDLQIDGVDESWFRTVLPLSGWTQDFLDFDPPDFGAFETTNDPANPVFSIFGTVNEDFGLMPPPSDPDRFMYASWLVAFNRAWDFTVAGSGGDSAVLYFWGAEEDEALVLAENEEVSKTAYLATVLFGEPPQPQNVPALDWVGAIILVALLGGLLIVRRRL